MIRHLGLDRLIERVGKKEIVKRIGIDEFLASLSPAERRELKRRLRYSFAFSQPVPPAVG